MNRRNLLKSSAAASTLLVCCQAISEETPPAIEGYRYRLPKFKKGSRLLFQGDSITDMKWGRKESDRNHYLGHSYVYLIAARLGVEIPEAELNFFNRGNSGNKVSDLRKRWQKDAIDLQPDLLSILVGVNDVGRDATIVDIEAWEKDYRFILDQSRTANPELKLVLLDPFVLPSGKLSGEAAFKKWRTQVDQMIPVVNQLVIDYGAVQIKTQDLFDDAAKKVSPEHWIWDGVHPLPQGHELIARQWIEKVSLRWS